MGKILEFTGCTINSEHRSCFDKLSEDEKQLIEDNSVKIKYKKGEIICKQGALVSHIMYLEQGLVKVFLDDGVNSLVLKIIPDGNLLGLASVSEEHNKYQYSVSTYIDSEVRQIDINVFRTLLKQNADFSRDVIDILSANSLQVYGRFFCLTYKHAYGRLADILLCLSNRIFKKPEFELPLSRKDLAGLSGMTSETVIRMLKKFNEDGLIRMEGKSFKILDYERLLKISESG